MSFSKKLLTATRIAVKAHDQQRRKGVDEPYVVHPLRVAEIVSAASLPAGISREHCIFAAILHDVLEDSEIYSRNDLKREFGISVADIVVELTQDKSLPKAERRKRMLEHCATMSMPAKIVKLADRLDNMREMKDLGEEFIQRYCQEARVMLKQMEGACPELEREIARLIKIYS